MKLLLTGALKYSDEQINKLENIGFEILFIQDERVPLQIDVSNIDVVVCNGLFLYNDISKFKNLKLIQLTSAGLDRVPLQYIEEKGITLFNAKGIYSIPMAEWVVTKILEIYKKSRTFYEAQNKHQWEKQRDLLELNGKTAVIVGYGDVGIEVAKRLKAFGMSVIGVGRRPKTTCLIDKYLLIDQIDEVLKVSDVVILTLPLTDETTHFINSDRISMMKDDSILINVSRGKVIKESDLIDSLNSNKFLGIALDVFEEEPLTPCNPLWDSKKVLITPHNSFVSDRVNVRLFDLIINNLVRYFKGS